MAERKSVNKYYPPDWDPSKGSVNKYVGQHPLRDRARKLGQGILIIRFELPYNIWCGGCGAHVGMGVRYNAEKSKTGMYYTTPIYKFRMKCHLCDNHFEIQTDPKNHDYVILEGARRKEQRWDPKENGQIETEDKAVQKKMATDAMFKLEHGSDDVTKGQKVKSNLSSLETRRDEWKDDYMLNKLARHKFREEKKAIKTEAESDAALLTKSSLDIPLQAESEHDVKLASLIKYRAIDSYDERQAKKRKEIESRPLFQTGKLAKIDNSKPENNKLSIIKNNLKSVKHGSPFDRMKMNTLVSGSPISKSTLGIKKKTLPKTTGSITTTSLSQTHVKYVETIEKTDGSDDSVDTENRDGSDDSVDTENRDGSDDSVDTENRLDESDCKGSQEPSPVDKNNLQQHVACDMETCNSCPENTACVDSELPDTGIDNTNGDENNHEEKSVFDIENSCDISTEITVHTLGGARQTPQPIFSLVSAYSDSESDGS